MTDPSIELIQDISSRTVSQRLDQADAMRGVGSSLYSVVANNAS